MKQNNHEQIGTNKKTQPYLTRKIVAVTFISLDVVAIPLFFVIYNAQNYEPYSYTNKRESTYQYVGPSSSKKQGEEAWISEANTFDAKMQIFMYRELSKQGTYTSNPVDIVCVTYNEKDANVYDFNIAAAVDGKLYKLTILNIETNDIQRKMYDMSDTEFDSYGFSLSYTTITHSVPIRGQQNLYISKDLNDKELVTGYTYDDHTYFIFLEHECAEGTSVVNEVPEQTFSHGSLIENYYCYLKDIK